MDFLNQLRNGQTGQTSRTPETLRVVDGKGLRFDNFPGGLTPQGYQGMMDKMATRSNVVRPFSEIRLSEADEKDFNERGFELAEAVAAVGKLAEVLGGDQVPGTAKKDEVFQSLLRVSAAAEEVVRRLSSLTVGAYVWVGSDNIHTCWAAAPAGDQQQASQTRNEPPPV